MDYIELLSGHQGPIGMRSFANNDAEAYANIYNQYLGKSTFDLVPKNAQYFTALSLQSRTFLFSVCRKDELIGWALIKPYSDRKGYQFTCETSVYLDSSVIGKGIGSQVKRHLLDICRNKGYHHIVAKIIAQNEASIHYNLKLGYRIVGTQHEVGKVHGKWQDVVIMEYLIDRPQDS